MAQTIRPSVCLQMFITWNPYVNRGRTRNCICLDPRARIVCRTGEKVQRKSDEQFCICSERKEIEFNAQSHTHTPSHTRQGERERELCANIPEKLLRGRPSYLAQVNIPFDNWYFIKEGFGQINGQVFFYVFLRSFAFRNIAKHLIYNDHLYSITFDKHVPHLSSRGKKRLSPQIATPTTFHLGHTHQISLTPNRMCVCVCGFVCMWICVYVVVHLDTHFTHPSLRSNRKPICEYKSSLMTLTCFSYGLLACLI